ncbi:hypothetical protein [Aliagarivorans marinus]|uniref:hypothetical protein n=1 Tax=Aliagarivorans marinus TaxID=561965 RepID=UPI000479B779|nr:hypothetical protein [Aliagarivorans marinus]
MDAKVAFEIAQAVLLSVGGASIIILGLSAWLGRVWAHRLMENDRAKHQTKLTELRTKLEKDAEHGNHLLRQKIDLYKEVANPVIELVSQALHHGALTGEDLKEFDSKRLETTALLAMFAPHTVFEKYNDMIDYIYDSVEGKQQWTFNMFRDKALVFLSEVRRDVGLYQDNVTYDGSR